VRPNVRNLMRVSLARIASVALAVSRAYLIAKWRPRPMNVGTLSLGSYTGIYSLVSLPVRKPLGAEARELWPMNNETLSASDPKQNGRVCRSSVYPRSR
jgi:hypothetical protein